MGKLYYKKERYWALLVSLLLFSLACGDGQPAYKGEKVTLASPDGRLSLTFKLKDGIPFYTLQKNGSILLNDSRLGLKTTGVASFDKNLVVKAFTRREAPTDHDEQEVVKFLHVHLQEASSQAQMNIEFKISNTSLKFRYIVPEQNKVKTMPILEELTEFSVANNYDVWWAPVARSKGLQSGYSKKSKVSDISEAVQVPLLLGYRDSLYLSIKEEGAEANAASLTLLNNGNNTLKSNLHHQTVNNAVALEKLLPFASPWRTIQLANSPIHPLSSSGGIAQLH